MCIDIHAVGLPITISFLHEQIWFEVGHNSLKAAVVCDAFIVNESPEPIQTLRLLFPHFVTHREVEVFATREGLQQFDLSADQYGWMGRFERVLDGAENEPPHLSFKSDFCDPTLREPQQPYRGQMLAGTLTIPAQEAADYSAAMKKIDRAALDLELLDELPGGHVGWLRLKINPTTWPHQSQLVGLQGLEIIDGPYEFSAGIQIESPSHLRSSLHRELRHNQWYNEVVELGWRRHGTLSRLEDHRISLIYPPDVQISHVVNTPDHAIEAIGPIPFRSARRMSLLHFATGSNFNRSSDIVILAGRVHDYCQWLSTERKEFSTPEQLVNRFGGSEHEAIGTLVGQMIDAKVLKYVDEQQEKVTVGDGASRARILELRKNYAFPVRPLEFGEGIRDLHPFQISASFRWTSFTDDQKLQMKEIREFSKTRAPTNEVPTESTVTDKRKSK